MIMGIVLGYPPGKRITPMEEENPLQKCFGRDMLVPWRVILK